MKANKVYIKNKFSIFGLVFKLVYLVILLAIGFLFGGLYMSSENREAIRSSSAFTALMKYEYLYRADKFINSGISEQQTEKTVQEEQAEVDLTDEISAAKASVNTGLITNSLSKEIALVFPEFELSALPSEQQEKIKSIALKNVLLTSNPNNFTNDQIDAIVQKSIDNNFNPLLSWALINSKDADLQNPETHGVFKIKLERAIAFAKLEGKTTTAMELDDFQYGLDFGLRRLAFFYEVYSKDKILTLLAEHFSNAAAEGVRDTKQAMSFDQIAYLTKVHEHFTNYSETIASQQLVKPETQDVAVTELAIQDNDIKEVFVEETNEINENLDPSEVVTAEQQTELADPLPAEEPPVITDNAELQQPEPQKQVLRPMKKIVSDLIAIKILAAGISEDQMQEILAGIAEQCSANQMDPVFTAALIMQESSFNPEAVSNTGKMGLMQIHPLEASKLAAFAKVELQSGVSLVDINNNLKVGVSYLAFLNKLFRGNKEHIALAYNMGAKQFLDAAKSRSPIPAEVSAYKNAVMQSYVKWLRELTPSPEPAAAPDLQVIKPTETVQKPAKVTRLVGKKPIQEQKLSAGKILDTKDLDRRHRLTLPPVQIVGVR